MKLPSRIFLVVFLFKKNGITTYRIAKIVYQNLSAKGRISETLNQMKEAGLVLEIQDEEDKRRKFIKPNIEKMVEELDRLYNLSLNETERKSFIKFFESLEPHLLLNPLNPSFSDEDVHEFVESFYNFAEFIIGYLNSLVTSIDVLSQGLNVFTFDNLRKNKKKIRNVFNLLGWSQFFNVVDLILDLPYSLIEKLKVRKSEKYQPVTFASIVAVQFLFNSNLSKYINIKKLMKDAEKLS